MARYGRDPKICVRASPTTFNAPLKWARQVAAGKRTGIDRVVFTCSWSDFFNPEADEWRADAWDIIGQTIPQLKYLILTKLPERIPEHLPAGWGDGWPGVGLGTSIENQEALWRLDSLRDAPAEMRFLSLEPLLESLGQRVFRGIDWLLIGGESGPKARPFNPRWGDEVASYAHGTAVHWKQMGSNCRNDLGEEIRFHHPHGADPSEWLESRRVQDFPPGWIETAAAPEQLELV